MTESAKTKMTFDVAAKRISSEASVAFCKNAKIDLDTNLSGTQGVDELDKCGGT
jgi:hypothetical protein